MKNCVYRFLNKNNEVIYIGKAKDLKNRLNNHNHLHKECYDERDSIEYIEFKTEDDMEFAERYYIMKLNPKYNTILSDKDFNITSTELDFKLWRKFRDFEYTPHIENNEDVSVESKIALLSDELKLTRAKIETIRECVRSDFENENKTLTNMLSNLINKESEVENKLISELRIKYGNEEDWVLQEFVKYAIYDKSEIIKRGIKKIEDEFFKKCRDEIIKNGYYKEDIYELIDFRFYCNESRRDWRYMLQGEYNSSSYMFESYTVNEELKNRIVNYIIDNIQNKIEDEFGLLEKEIVMLDNTSDDKMIHFTGFEYRRFLKPFMVYKVS